MTIVIVQEEAGATRWSIDSQLNFRTWMKVANGATLSPPWSSRKLRETIPHSISRMGNNHLGYDTNRMHQYGRFTLGRWFVAPKLGFLVESSPCRSFCQILL